MDLHLNALLPALLLLAVAGWELVNPCRPTEMSRLYRWVNMGAMRVTGKIFFRVVMPLTQVQFAFWCERNGYGLFNHFTLPVLALGIVTILLLDLSSYLMHAAAHQNQFLWRFHRTHHLDTEFDITTALRTHPLDDLQNAIAEFIFIFLFGLSPEGIVIYAVISGAVVKFSHANVELSDKLDRFLRWFIVTPNMHRIHHSAERYENDSNYSTHFTIWDRLFRTHTLYPSLPHGEMKIGLHQFRDPKEIRIDRLLLRPFTDKE